jgi:hypothetical protein
MGKVAVDMDGTLCKVPTAVDCIKQIEQRGAIGNDRKNRRNADRDRPSLSTLFTTE